MLSSVAFMYDVIYEYIKDHAIEACNSYTTSDIKCLFYFKGANLLMSDVSG